MFTDVVYDAPAIEAQITLRKGLTGAKPETVCGWVLDLLNVQPGDTVDDLFPGTGVMGRVVADRQAPNLLTPLADEGHQGDLLAPAHPACTDKETPHGR